MWLSINLYFESIVEGDDGGENLWEERILLIHSASEADAMGKISDYCHSESELRYESAVGRMVTIRFVKWGNLFELIDDPGDGAEVYSRSLLESEARMLANPSLFPDFWPGPSQREPRVHEG